MNVNEIRDRILEVSHDEVAPDTDLKLKCLGWLNSAYHEIIGVCMPYLERYIQNENLIEIVDGKGVLPEDVYRILTVIDIDTGLELYPRSHADIVKYDVEFKSSGSSKSYWINGNNIYVYPNSDTKIKIIYLKQVSDLLDGGAEFEILIPKQFHHGLVWGGLVWSSIFERGFSSQGDLKIFQKKWDEVKREVKLSLASQPLEKLKVKSFEII